MRRVFLYDTQPLRGLGLQSMLRNNLDFQFDGFSRILNSAILADGQIAVIADDGFRKPDLIRFLASIKEPELVVILTEKSLGSWAEAIQRGVTCIGDLSSSEDALIELLEAAAHGQTNLKGIIGDEANARFAQLSGRERQLAGLVGEGKKNKEIASMLSISPRTVKVHLTNIFEKTGCKNRLELTLCVRARKNG
jgi:DNA-binding NarL/FixJ family response regulator